MALDFIGTSLELLRREYPPAYALLCSNMAGRSAQLTISGEPLWLSFTAHGITVAPGNAAGEPALRLTTDWDTILDLVDARLSMIDAVLCGRFDLHGEGRELARFYDATLTYLRGGIRCPSFPALLDRLRATHGGL